MPRLTIDQQNYIKENYLNYPGSFFANKLKIYTSSYYKYLERNNLVVPKELQLQWKIQSSLRPFTEEEKQFLLENISNHRLRDLAKIMKRSTVSISKQCYEMGLKDILQEKSKKYQFPKGHISANKGEKMEEFLTPEQIEKVKQTQFKKGNIPHNSLPDGTEVERVGKCGRRYILIKVPEQRRLSLKQRYLWEKENGPIPKNHVIRFKDGDAFNFNMDNLECISLKENMERNSMHRFPKEITKLIILKGSVNRQINKHKNNLKIKNHE